MDGHVAKKIDELKQTRCDGRVVDAIATLLESGSDLDLYKINAFRFAQQHGVDRTAALRGFLFATRLGLFDMSWDIYCPSCRGLPEYHRHMMGLSQRGHCMLCQIDWDLDFERQVEVTFTVNPSVRVIAYRDFSERDFTGKMQFISDILGRERRQFEVGECIEPGKPLELTHAFKPGRYIYWVTETLRDPNRLTVSDESADEIRNIDVSIDATGLITPVALALEAGPVRLRVQSQVKGMQGFLIAEDKPFENWVSAHFVAMQQDFKDLFDAEFLSPETSFSIKNLTLMFTDLKDSTKMYEVVGDARAYSLVKSHFAELVESIRRFEGGVVKTIGDAVMAVFPTSEQALEASMEIQRNFMTKREALAGLMVKIGIHRGPVIAVNSNNHLDYFGRTVNMAARVQGKSIEDEVLLSDEVSREPAVARLIAARGWRTRSFTAPLKGIDPDPTLHSVAWPG